MRRFFARFYNEKPQRPIKIPEELKNNLRNAPSTQQVLRKSIKEFRLQLPLLSLTEISKLSKAHLKAFHFIPNIISSNDERLEPELRKSFFKSVLDPQFKIDLEYYEDKILVLDKSAESRRNYLLAKEAEEVEKALRANEEVKRIERLRDVEKIRFRPEVLLVDQVLDKEINNQVVEVDTHTVLSSKGVVRMNSLPGKMPRFQDLTGQELSNYVCFNLQNVEQALQMAVQSKENINFDSNMRAQILQKIVLMEIGEVKDNRLVELIDSIEINQLSKKNVANTLWALGKLHSVFPRRIKKAVEELTKRFVELVPVSNSMNIAYAVDGLKKLGIFESHLVESITNRFLTLVDSVKIPSKPNPSDVYYLNIPLQGHSYFYGGKDLTIPQTVVPGQAVFRVLRYLKNAGQVQILPLLYKKTAMMINSNSLYELDKNLLIDGLSIFSQLSEQQMIEPNIKKLVLNMSQLVLKYNQELTLPQVSLVSHSILRTKSFDLTAWFKVLQLKSFESAEFYKEPSELLPVCHNFVKYFVAVKHGRDLDIEPLAWIFNTFYVQDSLFNKLAELCESKKIPDEVLNTLGKYLGIVGYVVNTTTDNNAKAIIAASIQGYPHECLVEVGDELLKNIIKDINKYDEVCELAAVFRKHGTKVNWNYFEQFYLNNKDFITSQPHRIALAWSLGKKVEVEYESELLTKTEFKMLETFINPEKIVLV